MEFFDWLIEGFSKPLIWFLSVSALIKLYSNNRKEKYIKEQEEEYERYLSFRDASNEVMEGEDSKMSEWERKVGYGTMSFEEWQDSEREDSEREDSDSKTKDKKPLNQIQKICILVFIACFWLWVGFGDGFRPQYSVIAFAIGITSIVAFFLFKDR